MMSCYTGTRGIGKTYQLSKLIYQKYKEGYFIISNMRHHYSNVVIPPNDPELLFETIKEVLVFKNQGYQPCDLHPSFKHSGILIAIDEAHLFFNADMWKRYSQPENMYIINFLSQARKIDCHVVLTVQDPSKLDINFRRYTEEWYRYRALIPIRYFKKIKHPTKDSFHREMRYVLPIAIEEEHKLPFDNPVFSEKTSDGKLQGTLVWSRFKLFGWLDPFPYKLYDSLELVGIDIKNLTTNYKIIKNFEIKPHDVRPTSLTGLLLPKNRASASALRELQEVSEKEGGG